MAKKTSPTNTPSQAHEAPTHEAAPDATDEAATATDAFQESFGNLLKINETLLESMPGMTAVKGSAFQTELSKAYVELITQIVHKPDEWMKLQSQYMQDQMKLWMSFWGRTYGMEAQPVVQPEKNDKRFASEQWSTNPYFDFIKQSYLLTTHLLNDTLHKFQLPDEDSQRKLNYQMKQFIDALSPSNFAATNPEVLQAAIETKGQSLVSGLQHMMEDMQAGRVKMSDMGSFSIGQNIATAPGAVVYENALIQLLQFTPATEQVYEIPLLILPPWINKYYILDLTQESSFIRYATEQGFTVFVVSWRNIPPEMGHTSWDDYLSMGALKAMDVVKEICAVPKINVIGYCIGGTLLASALSILKTRKQDVVNAVTFFTAMIDFSYTGEISVFVDEAQIREREKQLKNGGVMSGNQMANAFAFLRANDLVWNYVVNNYLKGKDYAPMDLLYWNGDPTNLPGNMYVYYLRNMYLENNLVKPGKLTMLGEKIDVSQVDLPVLSIATREDHIAPWTTVFRSLQALGGNRKELVLGASGHIAGVVNHPSKNKREFWHGGNLQGDANHWLESAQNVKGSWWPYWANWLKPQSGKAIAARKQLGSKAYPELEAAPGRFVKEPMPVVPGGGLSL